MVNWNREFLCVTITLITTLWTALRGALQPKIEGIVESGMASKSSSESLEEPHTHMVTDQEYSLQVDNYQLPDSRCAIRNLP